MVAELDQEAANHWIHDQSDSGHDLLRTGSLPTPLAHAQPQKVLPPVLSGQRLHLVQLLLFVGSLQSPCPPAQQGEASLYKVKCQVQYLIFSPMSFSIYLTSLILTLYFAMGLQSAILTPIAACAQVNPLLMPCLRESLNYILILCPGCGSCVVRGFIHSWWTNWSQVMSPQKTCQTLSKPCILLFRFMTKMCSGFCRSSVNKNLPV